MNRTLEIDFNKKCKRCSEPGAVDNGLCLACLLKAIENGEADYIIKKHFEGLEKSK